MAKKNSNLHAAKEAKNDEFYTQLSDIEKELKHYKEHFRNKIVLCNCDDPDWSEFWKYFFLNFEELGLKKLISTHYDANEPTYKLEMTDAHTVTKTSLLQNGDFRSDECLALLEESDIVVTNPPFSLFREYVATLIEHEKKFVIVGNKNAVTYKEIFPLIKNNELWIGMRSINSDFWLRVPEGNEYEKIIDGVKLKHIMACWYTNIDISKRHEDLVLWQRYYEDDGVTPRSDSEARYPHYDNYDAINVDRVQDIPCDYFGVIGVPITFLDKFNPEQFEIMGCSYAYGDVGEPWHHKDDSFDVTTGGRRVYKRIFIRLKKRGPIK